MSDPARLEERLRKALGAGGPLGARAPGPGADLDAARTQVLSGIRRRRLRRLQVSGALAVVVLGLALSLPQVLGSTTPPTQATGTHAKSTPAANAPMHGAAIASPSSPAPPTRKAKATCHVEHRMVGNCGTLATNAAAAPLSATAASLGKAAAFAHTQTSATLGSPLVVRPGTIVTIDLPRVKTDWRWGAPTIAGSPVHHGTRAAVTVHAARSTSATQQFLVTTNMPATVVLEAQDDVFTGKGAAPSIVAGSADVWALELKVEEK